MTENERRTEEQKEREGEGKEREKHIERREIKSCSTMCCYTNMATTKQFNTQTA